MYGGFQIILVVPVSNIAANKSARKNDVTPPLPRPNPPSEVKPWRPWPPNPNPNPTNPNSKWCGVTLRRLMESLASNPLSAALKSPKPKPN